MKQIVLLVLPVIFLVSCHEENKKFVCVTCENEIHGRDSVTGSGDCDGKNLFKRNCASCHNASSRPSTGPGLMGVWDRVPGREWVYAFVRNSDSVIKSGDGYANKIYHEYNQSRQIKFPNLTNEEIDAILDYANPAPQEQIAN